jgi:hypothetical protein
MLVNSERLFVEGIEHEPPAWNTNFSSTLQQQQQRTFCISSTESPDLCTVTRSATLPRFSDSRTFYSK